MSSFHTEILPQAEAEAREAFLWYFDRSPIAADAFRVELFDAIDGLASMANDWPEDPDGNRRYHLRHFPYTVMYEVLGEISAAGRHFQEHGYNALTKRPGLPRRIAQAALESPLVSLYPCTSRYSFGVTAGPKLDVFGRYKSA